MAIKYYEGVLGKFEYDDKEFELRGFAGCYDDGHYLHYIGHEPDGRKIKIPDGIINCESMFSDCEFLVKPPVIPEGTINCDYMFADSGLTGRDAIPIIPVSVEKTLGMFMHTNIEHRYSDVIGWHIKHRGQAYSDWSNEIIIPNIKCHGSSGYYKFKEEHPHDTPYFYEGHLYGGDINGADEVGITVPKSFSRTGEARIWCSTTRVSRDRLGSSYIYELTFEKDNDISVYVVGPNEDEYEGHIETLKISELAELAKTA